MTTLGKFASQHAVIGGRNVTGGHRAEPTARSNAVKLALAVGSAIALIIGCAALIVALTNGNAGSGRSDPFAAATAGLTLPPGPTITAATPTPAATAPAPAVLGPLTYTVKPGDNLSVIAAWFNLRGYGALYEANKTVIGSNPALIRPGQVITISSQGVTIG